MRCEEWVIGSCTESCFTPNQETKYPFFRHWAVHIYFAAFHLTLQNANAAICMVWPTDGGTVGIVNCVLVWLWCGNRVGGTQPVQPTGRYTARL